MSAKLGWAQYDFVYLDYLFSVYCYVYVTLFMVNVEVSLVISFDLSFALGYSVSGTTLQQ